MTAEPEPATPREARRDPSSVDRIECLGEQEMREALQALELAVCILDGTGRITWCSPGFLRLTGFSVREVLGRRRTELISGPFLRTEGLRELEENLAGSQRFLMEFVTRSRDGTPYWTQLEASPRSRNGRPDGMTVLERDITERRKVEEHGRQSLSRAHSLALALRHEKHLLSTVLATIPHLVWWKDVHSRYSGANAAYLAMRGLDSEAAVIGRLERQLDVTDTIGEHLARLEKSVIAAGKPAVEATITVPADTGLRTLLISVFPHKDNVGEPLGTIGVGVDITSSLELERQLAQTSRLESLGQLSAGIAHELNTPVQYVRDNTQFVHESCNQVIDILRRVNDLLATPTGPPERVTAFVRRELAEVDIDFLGQEVPSALEQSLEGLDRVTQIVRAMKEFSHPGSGRNPTDLNRLVETTAQVSRSEWRYIADLELDLDPDLERVPCIEGEVKQALLNIVVNAAHAIQERQERREGRDTGAARGRILIRTRRRDHEAEITVQDDGIGMTDTVKEKIFDPFFTTKDVGRGTGQGLNLAHGSIVGKHSGRFEVRSSPGQGSTFTILLPLGAPEDDTGVPAVDDTTDDDPPAATERTPNP